MNRSSIADLTPALADALYEATHGDVELNLRDGVAVAEIERTAATLRTERASAALGAVRRVVMSLATHSKCPTHQAVQTSLSCKLDFDEKDKAKCFNPKSTFR